CEPLVVCSIGYSWRKIRPLSPELALQLRSLTPMLARFFLLLISEESSMKRCMHLVAVVLLAGSLFILASPVGTAGRIGGPMSTVSMAPAGLSVYYDISFAEGETAVVSINGNGKSLMF